MSRSKSPLDRSLLDHLMSKMAAGDQAALFPFIEEFGSQLTGAVRATLRSIGRHDLAVDPDAVEFHVQSAAFVIFDRSAGWSSEGALPWTWAAAAIRAAVVADVGHRTSEWDETAEVLRDQQATTVTDAEVDLAAMAAEQPEIAVLIRAVEAVASERDAVVHLEYQIQKGLGDRQPAITIGHMLGLTPANVRKIDQRVRERLSVLAETDADFALLATVSWVEKLGNRGERSTRS